MSGYTTCPCCKGDCVVTTAGPDYFGNYDSDDCPLCNGMGEVRADVAADYLFEAAR